MIFFCLAFVKPLSNLLYVTSHKFKMHIREKLTLFEVILLYNNFLFFFSSKKASIN